MLRWSAPLVLSRCAAFARDAQLAPSLTCGVLPPCRVQAAERTCCSPFHDQGGTPVKEVAARLVSVEARADAAAAAAAVQQGGGAGLQRYSVADRTVALLVQWRARCTATGVAYIADPVLGTLLARVRLVTGCYTVVAGGAATNYCRPSAWWVIACSYWILSRKGSLISCRNGVWQVAAAAPCPACTSLTARSYPSLALLQVEEVFCESVLIPSSWVGERVLVPVGRAVLMLRLPGGAIADARSAAASQQHPDHHLAVDACLRRGCQ